MFGTVLRTRSEHVPNADKNMLGTMPKTKTKTKS